jgi:hypothetical protein
MSKVKLGIDVGGVLIEKKDSMGADTNFSPEDVKWVPGALAAVEKLQDRYDLYILSFCGKKTEAETREALGHGVAHIIPEDKWMFTRKREHKVKRMKENGISILIDDTKDIIDLVTAAGLVGIWFRSSEYPVWRSVTEHLMKENEDSVNNEKSD